MRGAGLAAGTSVSRRLAPVDISHCSGLNISGRWMCGQPNEPDSCRGQLPCRGRQVAAAAFHTAGWACATHLLMSNKICVQQAGNIWGSVASRLASAVGLSGLAHQLLWPHVCAWCWQQTTTLCSLCNLQGLCSGAISCVGTLPLLSLGPL